MRTLTLPGVGRKTANVVLGNAFGVPGITVDTHFMRLAKRFGWTESTDPVRIEADVAALFEPKDWTMLSHRVVFHGRRICHARKPACGACPIAHLCPAYGDGEVDPVKAAKLLKYELAPGQEALLARMQADVDNAAQYRQESQIGRPQGSDTAGGPRVSAYADLAALADKAAATASLPAAWGRRRLAVAAGYGQGRRPAGGRADALWCLG